MPPQQAPDQNQPNPVAPQPPQPQLQPTQVVPASTSRATSSLELGNIDKEKKKVLWLTLGSLAIFSAGFLFGFAALIGAALGIFGVRKAKLINYRPGFVLGIIGTILNVGFYFLIIISHYV